MLNSQLTLNQRVQGSSPCAPTIEITDEISTNAEVFPGWMGFGSAPGKHFCKIKSASRMHDEAIQATPHVPMVGVTKMEVSWPAPRPMPAASDSPSDRRPSGNVSGPAVRNRDPPHPRIFPKPFATGQSVRHQIGLTTQLAGPRATEAQRCSGNMPGDPPKGRDAPGA